MTGLLPLLTGRAANRVLERSLSRRTAVGFTAVCAAGIAAAGIGATIPHSSVRAESSRSATGCDPTQDAPGLLADDHWQGLTFGLDVSWDAVRWSIGKRSNPGVAKAIGREDRPIDCGFGQGGSDRLMLANGMWESGVVMIESYDRLMWTLPEMADAMTLPGWATNLRVASTSELLIAEVAGDSLVAVAGDDDLPEHTVYRQLTFPEDDESVIHQLTLHMWEAGAVYALHDLEGVEIAGIDSFAVVDLEMVRQVLDDYLDRVTSRETLA